MTDQDDLRLRFAHQEAALLALHERVAVLERALDFEVAQRESMEAVIMQLVGLRRRVDRLERQRKARAA